MKKVFSLVLAFTLLVSMVSVVSATGTELVGAWGFEHRAQKLEWSSDGIAEVYFPTVRETDMYLLKLYKDGQLVYEDEMSADYEQEYVPFMITDVVAANGSGTYTYTVSALDSDIFSESYGEKVLFTSAMSTPFVYTKPQKKMLQVHDVECDGTQITFTHDNQGIEATYEMEFYVEYGDVCRERFTGGSSFKPVYPAEHFSRVIEYYERQLEEDKEENPDLVKNGAPKLLVVIYAKAWDINQAQQSYKTYFYPFGEKPTVTVPDDVWTVSKNAQLSFAGNVTTLEAYNISDNNYFKLRDLALKLTEMGVLVDVTWDAEKNAINLVTGQPYTVVGGELKSGDDISREAILSDARVYLNGEEIKLTAYNIQGNNFFKLRDLCGALGVSVDWDESAQLIILNR